MQEQISLWTAEGKVNVYKNKFTFEQRKEKQMYAGTSLLLNSGKKSKCMQEQNYLWTAEIKANLYWNKFTFEQRKEK